MTTLEEGLNSKLTYYIYNLTSDKVFRASIPKWVLRILVPVEVIAVVACAFIHFFRSNDLYLYIAYGIGVTFGAINYFFIRHYRRKYASHLEGRIIQYEEVDDVIEKLGTRSLLLKYDSNLTIARSQIESDLSYENAIHALGKETAAPVMPPSLVGILIALIGCLINIFSKKPEVQLLIIQLVFLAVFITNIVYQALSAWPSRVKHRPGFIRLLHNAKRALDLRLVTPTPSVVFDAKGDPAKVEPVSQSATIDDETTSSQASSDSEPSMG